LKISLKKKNRPSKTIFFNIVDLKILLFLIPTLLCFQFWIKVLFKADLNIGSYFYLIVTLFVFRKIYKKHLKIIFIDILILCFLVLYASFLNLNPNESLAYLIHFNNLFLVVYMLPFVNFDFISKDEIAKSLTYFSIFFVIVYELSNTYALDRSNIDEYYDLTRIYKEGFVISHEASYYLAILGFFLFILNRRILAVLLWGYGLTLGPRIGDILIYLSILFSLINKYDRIKFYLQKNIYIITFAYIIILFCSFEYAYNKFGEEIINVFTSGRLSFWQNALKKIELDGFSTVNLLGRGSQASYYENLKVFQMKIWLHNDFFDVLFNLGVIGLIFYLYGIFYYLKMFKAIYVLMFFLLAGFFNGFILYNPVFIVTLYAFFYKKGLV
jgi:hypothetical protein